MNEPMAGRPRPAGPQVGLWGRLDAEDFGELAAAEALAHELEARMPGATIRRFAPTVRGERNPFDMGHPIGPLGERGSGDRLHRIVVTGTIETDGTVLVPEPFRRSGPSVVWSAVRVRADLTQIEGSREALERLAILTVRDEPSAERVRDAGLSEHVEIVPDPTVALARVWPREVIGRRLRTLRALEVYPARPPLVVQGGAADLGQVEGLAGSLRRIVESGPVVVVGTGPGDAEFADALVEILGPGAVHASPLGLQDVAAAIAAGRGFVGSSSAGIATAVAFDRPSVSLGWGDPSGTRAAARALGEPGSVVERAEDVPDAFEEAARRGDRSQIRRALVTRLDRHLDEVAEIVGEPAPPPEDTEERLEALRAAHRIRGDLLAAQRWQMAARVEDPTERIAELERQLAEIRDTKTFRYTAGLRRVYERWRARRRREG